MKTKTFKIIGLSLLAIVIIIVVVLAGSGRLFQGALYNVHPIYTDCKIEGANFNSTNLHDCETFYDEVHQNKIPNGEYTILTKYASPKLNPGITPVTVQNGQVSCNFTGYQPIVNLTVPDQLGTQTINSTAEYPVGSLGVIAQINYTKDNQVVPHDFNICEGTFQAHLLDANKNPLGDTELNHNGFINTRPLVNEIFISNTPYYKNAQGQVIKTFTPGNIFLTINTAPDLTFKLTIPCSNNLPQVTTDNVTTGTDVPIVFNGLSPEFINTCGSKLYLGFQNPNQASDIQNISPIELKSLDNNSASYNLKLEDLTRINNLNTVLPAIYTVKLFSRDSIDQQTVSTLGSFILNVTTDYQPIIPRIESDSTNSTTVTQTSTTSDTNTLTGASTEKVSTNTTDATGNPTVSTDSTSSETTTNEVKVLETKPVSEIIPNSSEIVKVRRSPEPILVLDKKVPEQILVLDPQGQ